MTDFYRFKKYDRAMNQWQAAKFAVWQRVNKEWDRKVVEQALASIGRNGYRATKGIDALDALIGISATETVVAAASAKIKIAKELGVVENRS